LRPSRRTWPYQETIRSLTGAGWFRRRGSEFDLGAEILETAGKGDLELVALREIVPAQVTVDDAVLEDVVAP
jgi:hypothetical protein